MTAPWHRQIDLSAALIGLLAVAAAVSCLALALAGYSATAGVIAIVCAVEAMLYALLRTQRPTKHESPRHPVPYFEPITGMH